MKNINEGLGLKFDKQAVGLAQQLFTKPFTVPVYGEYKGTRSMADGGPVVEPGPSTIAQDTVPARLNPDEYVIPKEVVMRKGTDFFDNLVEKSRKGGKGLPKPAPVMKDGVAYAANGYSPDEELTKAFRSNQFKTPTTPPADLNAADDISAATRAKPQTPIGKEPFVGPQRPSPSPYAGLGLGLNAAAAYSANKEALNEGMSTGRSPVVAGVPFGLSPTVKSSPATLMPRMMIEGAFGGATSLARGLYPEASKKAEGAGDAYINKRLDAVGKGIADFVGMEPKTAEKLPTPSKEQLDYAKKASDILEAQKGLKRDDNIYGPGGENLGPTGGRGLPKPEAAATEAQAQQDYFDRINEAQLALDRERLAMLRANTPAGSITPEQVVALIGSNRGEALADTYQSDAYRAAHNGSGYGDERVALAKAGLEYNMLKDRKEALSKASSVFDEWARGKTTAKGTQGPTRIGERPWTLGGAAKDEDVISAIDAATSGAAGLNSAPMVDAYKLIVKHGGSFDTETGLFDVPEFDDSGKLKEMKKRSFGDLYNEVYGR